MSDPRVVPLYEDNHLLALNKPPRLPTMGAPAGVDTLLTLARDYIKHKYNKPGNVYLGVVSRLDAPVTGVVLLARTSKAAARLTEQFRGKQVEKIYWAVVQQPPDPPQGECVDWIGKHARHRKVFVTHRDAPDAQEARLSYRTLGVVRGHGLLEVQLETGRKHQIRVQLARLGCPILGDRKYGAKTEFSPGIALHAARLRLEHPVGGEPLQIVAPLPPAWKRYEHGFAE